MPTRLRILASRIAALFSARSDDEDFQRELASHLALLTDDNIRRGMSAPEAARAARLRLGGEPPLRESHHDLRALRFLETLWHDVRFAARMLRKSPAFAAVAILTLALGIGANTAIFSLVEAVLLRPLPIENPQQLVSLEWVGSLGVDQTGPSREDKAGNTISPLFSYPAFERLKTGSQENASLFGFVQLGDVNLSINGARYLVPAEVVTPGYFAGLGVRPVLGRALTPQDARPSSAPAAVISYNLWSTRFNRSQSALGSIIAFSGTSYAIVGVAPPGFFGLDPSATLDLWVPFVPGRQLGPYGMTAAPQGESPFVAERWWWMYVAARPKPGIARGRVQAQLDTLLQGALAVAHLSAPQQRAHIRLAAASRGLDTLREQYSDPLLVLMVVVAVVLLIACANLAALLSARATSRGKEIAVRLALGATRGRLIRQLLVESVLLSFSGALIGLLFGAGGLRLLTGLTTEDLPLSIGINGPVLLFTTLAALATAVAFGLAPAFRATRVEIAAALKQTSRYVDCCPRRSLIPGQSLVVTQVAASLLFLVAAGLFLRTLRNYETEPMGFDPSHLLLSAAAFDQNQSDAGRADFSRRLRARVSALPGVQAVGTSNVEILSGDYNSWPAAVENRPGKTTGVFFMNVGPGFFDAMRIPLLAGRPIAAADASAANGGAVISHEAARAIFGAENPLGHRITFPGLTRRAYQIVGISGDAKYLDLQPGFPKTIYLPFSDSPDGPIFEIRTAGDPAALAPAVRAIAREIDPGVPLTGITTQANIDARALIQQRLLVRVAGFFGPLALLLAFVGFYGVLSYSVARRSSEIGIRMALGARPRDVLSMILRQGAVVAAIGVAAGILVSLALSRLIAHQLFGVRATDPVTYALASAALILIALVACCIPARRAMRVDPATAMRCE